MTAHGIFHAKSGRKAVGVFMLPFAVFTVAIVAIGAFLVYVLWPSWPNAPAALDAPAMPITVAGVLFEVPPAAIRTAVQRHAGAHERIDLVFAWPSLAPPEPTPEKSAHAGDAGAMPPAPSVNDRLFVTIAGLGAVLPPVERLRTIYPRYVEAQAASGADGLAILPFRAATPYQGEDLVYVAANPEQFFARCTVKIRAVPGTCIHERALEAAEVTLRFPREWLQDWRGVAAGFDRLMAQIHSGGGGPATEDR
ncbi:MAG TPA: hypothetical protein VEJ37_03190 [Xanthobacteraceae bacterium]|nr:hypothetical protein [Xanthobacteraceae bacterium]